MKRGAESKRGRSETIKEKKKRHTNRRRKEKKITGPAAGVVERH